jgi:hypothetical protein
VTVGLVIDDSSFDVVYLVVVEFDLGFDVIGCSSSLVNVAHIGVVVGTFAFELVEDFDNDVD